MGSLEEARRRQGTGLYATVRVIAQEMARRGLDVTPLLKRSGLSMPTTWRPMRRAARGAVLEFVERCIEHSGDPGLHVVASAKARLGIYEVADYLVTMAPTVGHGLSAVGARFDLVNDGIRILLREGTADGDVWMQCQPVFEPAPHPIEIECTFVAIEVRLRAATNGVHRLAEVCLSYPDRGAGAALGDVFACPIRFECPDDRVRIPARAWQAPSRFSHSAVGQLIHGAAPAPLPVPVELEASVRAAIRAALPDGVPELKSIAQRAGTGVRSLQRRLAALDLRYADLLDDVRRREALRLLDKHGASATEAAAALGYAELSAFSRAFRRWTGLAPSEYQARRDQSEG